MKWLCIKLSRLTHKYAHDFVADFTNLHRKVNLLSVYQLCTVWVYSTIETCKFDDAVNAERIPLLELELVYVTICNIITLLNLVGR